jgi:hypothetical protein
MGMTYRAAIAEGRRLYAEAMDKAANYVLFVVEEYGKPRATVCKEIAGEGWNALDHRARALEKTAGQTPDERRAATLRKTQQAAQAHAKAALKDPEQAAKVIASLPTEALETVYHEARVARVGEDRSEPARKAAAARAREAVEPMRRAVSRTQEALVIQALDEAIDGLRDLIADGALTSRGFERIDKRISTLTGLLIDVQASRIEA